MKPSCGHGEYTYDKEERSRSSFGEHDSQTLKMYSHTDETFFVLNPMTHISHAVSAKSYYRAQNNGWPAVNNVRPK